MSSGGVATTDQDVLSQCAASGWLERLCPTAHTSLLAAALMPPIEAAGGGGTRPEPLVSQLHAGLSDPPIASAVVLTTTRPALTSACRKSRNRVSLLGLMVYAPQCPPVERSQTRWNTNCTQSVDCVSASAL